MPLVMAGIPNKIIPLLDQYKITEQSIQTLIAPITQCFCRECAGTCCREEICRESVHSPFLNALVRKQAIAYSDVNGWLADSGCRLDYGRPQVCYAYFCNAVIEKQTEGIRRINAVIKAFSASGDRAWGATHLVGVKNLDELSIHKITKIINKMDRVVRMVSGIH